MISFFKSHEYLLTLLKLESLFKYTNKKCLDSTKCKRFIFIKSYHISIKIKNMLGETFFDDLETEN